MHRRRSGFAPVTVIPAAGKYEFLYGIASSLSVISPFLLATPDQLSDIDLTTLIPNTPNLANVAATGLAADGTSAAILLFQVSSAAEVTFTANNGTTLLDYDAKFLKYAPLPGNSTLKVKPIKIGSLLYAVALLQAPPAIVVPNYATPITITAQQQGGIAQQANLSLVPPPVVLIHGIWADQTSLSSIQNYLTTQPPWNSGQLIEPICYSKYLAYNAQTDPLTNGTDPCEQTSKAALTAEIKRLYSEMDQTGIVGGRFDVVAHSMGGLVIRNYAGTPGYKQFRNREEGAFHAVVTIDTPEDGSALAPYLIKNAEEPLRAKKGSGPWLLWEAKCSTTDVVRTCFDKLGLPLAASTLALNTGAVNSLIPTGAVTRSPDPNIPGVIWRAVQSVYPDKDQPTSLLRNVLNTLIAAIYPPTSFPPNTTGILDYYPNDVIVTAASQIGDIPTTSAYSVSDLAHTGSPYPTILGALLGGVDNNVLNSNAVNQVVACWLFNIGANSCTNTNPQETRPSATPVADRMDAPWVAKFSAPERLAVGIDTSQAVLNSPVEIPLTINTPGLLDIIVSQSDKHGEVHSASGPAIIVQHVGNTNYIKVTPERLGNVEIFILARFTDGGAAIGKVRLNVQPPAAAPTTFKVGDFAKLSIGVADRVPAAIFHPYAIYEGIPDKIYLDPSLITYGLLSESSDPAVTVTHNGLITAVHPGTAIIKFSYQGKSDQMTVVVGASTK